MVADHFLGARNWNNDYVPTRWNDDQNPWRQTPFDLQRIPTIIKISSTTKNDTAESRVRTNQLAVRTATMLNDTGWA